MNQPKTFKNGDYVHYDNGVIKGRGRVVGQSHIEQPHLGAGYIIQTETDISNESYDFPYHFICFALHLTLIDDFVWGNVIEYICDETKETKVGYICEIKGQNFTIKRPFKLGNSYGASWAIIQKEQIIKRYSFTSEDVQKAKDYFISNELKFKIEELSEYELCCDFYQRGLLLL